MDFEGLRDLEDYDTIAFKTASATVSSFVIGTIAGAVIATWQDIPAVKRGQAWPALQKTAAVMRNYGLTSAVVGGAFAAGDAVAQELRGKKDLWNGVFGSVAAGTVLGLRAGSIPVGVRASAVIAAISTIVDVSEYVSQTSEPRVLLPDAIDENVLREIVSQRRNETSDSSFKQEWKDM